MKKENRTERCLIRIKPSEKQYLKKESSERGQGLSEYIRAILFANAILVVPDDENNA